MVREGKIFYVWKVLAALFVVGAIGPMVRYSLTAFFFSIIRLRDVVIRRLYLSLTKANPV